MRFPEMDSVHLSDLTAARAGPDENELLEQFFNQKLQKEAELCCPQAQVHIV